MDTSKAELEALKQPIHLDEYYIQASFKANQDHITFQEYYEIPYLVDLIKTHNFNKSDLNCACSHL